MIISSIDIQGGKVVQLRQGRELVLQRDDPAALAAEFNRYGEVAVIDLDAAMGNHPNTEMITPLLHTAECRVGGGIKTVEQAALLVSLGAKKIIVGSAAFRTYGGFALNTEFLKALSEKIGRQRIIIAVDAKDGYIVADGWKTSTGLPLVETAKRAAEYAGELLFTCVEREGTMTGINLDAVKELRAAAGMECLITVAGGVATLDEVKLIAKLGCDVQLGMALYTGKINLADGFFSYRSISF
ncbi:1-(5-phosphoribosyl)-5-((5-phosphoribosylamino)methylideneamino)imidazole-4-carboxamide isomerase [Spirochaetia bacterium]|nr:1-(5-phosphoribosyl)-5-((5-phosphoribosylamino)methylideneamino)imidazole-4-carboxamide isomerase [Spirochaetia bacterium]